MKIIKNLLKQIEHKNSKNMILAQNYNMCLNLCVYVYLMRIE